MHNMRRLGHSASSAQALPVPAQALAEAGSALLGGPTSGLDSLAVCVGMSPKARSSRRCSPSPCSHIIVLTFELM